MRLRGFSLLAAALCAGSVFAAEEPTYTLGVPDLPGTVCYSPAGRPEVTNEWMNGAYVFSGGFSTEPAVTQATGDTTESTRYRLVDAEVCFSWERSKPEYYIADRIAPPEDVDWAKTQEAYDKLVAKGGATGFLFNPDPSNPGVYAVDGGAQAFTWHLKDGTSKTIQYTIGSTCTGRPRRIYWTDDPYNAPAVSLRGRFVKLFGNASIVQPTLGVTTNFTGGIRSVVSNVVVKGVYIDPTAQVLHAVGGVQGQFVVVFYDTGDYRNILHMEVVEACRPEAIVNTGEIGTALEPDGRSYTTEGLTANVTAGIGDSDDNRGDYLYQHAGANSYSPKHGDVFPLRPTVGKRWKAEIYWMETDPLGVQWPFEMDHYEIDWPKTKGILYVRGDLMDDYGAKIYIPTEYAASLEKYQEPEGHARAVTGDNIFTTTGAGWSLVRLTADDNIWFLPIHSVLRSDTDYFTLKPARILVGEEFRPRSGERMGVAEGFDQTLDVTEDVSGYIYEPASGSQYNPDLYYATTNATGSASATTSDPAVPSAVFAVNVSRGNIEVWWGRRVQFDGMPYWIDVPTLPQVYAPAWPSTLEAPTIAIASQQGSANECAWQQRGAAYFDSKNSSMRLASRRYFPNRSGTFCFWTRPVLYEDTVIENGITNPPSAILELGSTAGSSFVIRVGRDQKLEYVWNGEVLASVPAVPALARLNAWTFVAVMIRPDDTVRLYANAVCVREFKSQEIVDALSGLLDRNFAGVSQYAAGEEIGEAPSQEVADPIDCGTFGELRSAFADGRNVRLTNDVSQAAAAEPVTIASGVSVAIDLNGHTVRGGMGEAPKRMFEVKGALRLCDSAGGGAFAGSQIPSAASGGFAQVAKGGALTIDGGIVRGFASGDCGGAICVEGGAVTMNGGALASNAVVSAKSRVDGGAVCVAAGGSFVMNGGRIADNVARGANAHYGAVVVDGGTFVVNAGRVTGNTSENDHPGIGVMTGEIVLNGGVFDVEPSYANVTTLGCEGTYEEPGYYPSEGLWYVGMPAAPGRQISELFFCSKDIFEGKSTPAELQEALAKVDVGSEGVVAGYTFRPGADLVAEKQTATGYDVRHFTEHVLDIRCEARNVSLSTPGAPRKSSFTIVADEDTTPTVYYENDKYAVGFNPNEEHAFVKSGNGGHVVWPLRADLNTDGSSIPGVLASYVQGGKAKMQFFHVVVTNADWPVLAGACTVGLTLPGPHPLDVMDDPWLPEDFWMRDPAQGERPGVAYRDRKGQLWARAAGTLPTYMYYRRLEGFWFPQYDANEQPAEGSAVPWLSVFADPAAAVDPVRSAPVCWTWTASWPKEAETMCIGQTLTTASGGLPGVWDMKSVSVVYPTVHEETGTVKTVVLTDPTIEKSVAFDYNLLTELGLSVDANGGLVLRKGKYYFTELPPHLSNRLYVDTNNKKLCLTGELNEKKAGASVLYVNVLSANERETVKNVVPADFRYKPAYATWTAAVDALAPHYTEPNTMSRSGDEVKTSYLPRDHYALTAMGSTNWVVLVENDGPTENYEAEIDGVKRTVSMGVKEGDAISMKVFKVIDKYYEGRIVTREDENNLLSQRLSVLYTESFAGEADRYEFEWKSASPNKDGSVPDDYENVYEKRTGMADAATPRITIGEQGDTLANMVNKYWICRYRAKDASCPAWAVMGDKWSGWCVPPALAEGWVQRVLNNVTPFNQLMTDLYENKAETAISMIAKAGRPYQGDVAFNNEALTEHGLIELYETLLNKAESMSLLLKIDDDDANKQLLLCAERLHDLYGVLGDEAYSDAKNPTVGFGSNMSTIENQPSVDFGAASSGLFCFDNQVSSLLDEELCLLRGRTGESLPYVLKDGRKTLSVGPYYNRLLWNFTKGITAGEVAYAVNYNISGTETVALSEEQAAALYPQGHGDAYGHYLSALKGWYRLLRNPYFTWPRAQGEMNVADSAVNVDYYEEAKFAEAAAKLAKTAADVVDLTARKAWGDTGASLAGYRDGTNERSFGYGEWANRGAYGAFVNWAVGNSLLPADSETYGDDEALDRLFKDAALTRIDRGTVGELKEICEQVTSIQSAEDRADYGQNPLGLSADAIPFDITPIGANDGTKTHYEQIRERAGTAMANARLLLDKAQEYSNRLRMIQESTDSYRDAISEEEAAYEQELIGYFGTPFSDDIGVGKTYEQGYDGPDLLHYQWMDLSLYGLTSVNDTMTAKTYYFTGYDRSATSKLAQGVISFGEILADVGKASVDLITKYTHLDTLQSFDYNILFVNGSSTQDEYREGMLLKYEMTASGLVKKPDSITGRRLRQGTVQDRYGEFLTAYVSYLRAQDDYVDAIDKYESADNMANIMYAVYFTKYAITTAIAIKDEISAYKDAGVKMALNALECTTLMEELIEDAAGEAVPGTTGAGTTVITDPRALAAAATKLPAISAKTQIESMRLGLKNSLITTSIAKTTFKSLLDAGLNVLTYLGEVTSVVNDLADKAEKVTAKQREMHDAVLAMNTAVEAYRAEINKAEQVCEKRYQARMKQVSNLSQARYNDMLFRQLRNQALARYTASFDLAQKYVWEAAKAYDYETALLSSDKASGDEFLKQIVKSRSLGSFGSDGQPLVGDVGDTGLAGILAEMDANWLVLKPRLGINNPQPYATWFSLRGECFRILPGEDGDAAWAKELKKYWVDDIKSNADFRRHCQPLQSQFGTQNKEPGLIIPFETTIDFARNLFGNEMAGGDHAYDATWYATRIYAAGVWFDGYNAKTANAAKSAKKQLGDTPVVYLVPMGLDCMRVPGLEEGAVLGFNVVDQVIAAPYAIGSQHLNDLSWYPSASDGDLGGADATTKIRLHPSFRAYFNEAGGDPTDDKLDCTRLIGRSVWNTKWMLVIPAGQMNYDREKALSIFINGYDTNRDGKLDLKPVSDIRIGFKTYSNSGN